MKTLLIAASLLVVSPVQAGLQSNNLNNAYVYSVTSAKGGTEFVKDRLATVRDHGGAWMQITTDDIGYGHSAQAWLLGSPLREIRSEALCNVNGQPRPCHGRGTVTGYRRTWDASGREGGNFQYMVIPNGVGGPVRIDFQVR
ncbi:DUF4879 domain-containing protein [Xanthomonas sp. NCPPB 2632]|jgi:hypothetical protein|uniref:DUF4879 domain-containing protein n=1 Tax=Xanthomonas sp. NCPPB 2632 TaxID=3240912 RepID=UPI003517F5CD